uniref:Uncharacterized protein n=1 Tax=Cannabis sativa TaxID=3483 RepID=A0A803Q8Q5_CANSA
MARSFNMVSEHFPPLVANMAIVGKDVTSTVANGSQSLNRQRANQDLVFFNHNISIRLNDHNFLLWMRKSAIHQYWTRHPCPTTRQQNDLVERKHKHIVEIGLALLAQASLPLKFCDEGSWANMPNEHPASNEQSMPDEQPILYDLTLVVPPKLHMPSILSSTPLQADAAVCQNAPEQHMQQTQYENQVEMAEIAVGLAVDKLIPLLTNEAYLLRGIHKDVEGIKCDLDFLLAFLKDADARVDTNQINNNTNHGIKVWVEKLRRAAFEVEDVIDDYTHLMVKQQGNHPHIQRFISIVRKNACLVIKLKHQHDIASKIKDIRQRIRDINQTSASYGFNSTPHDKSSSTSRSSRWYDPRKDSCFIKESDLVGIESSRDELIRKVEDGSPMRTVISLLGMGGLGKTTLANQVYVHTKNSFDCYAWIEVSQTYKRAEILRILVKKFYELREECVPKGLDAMEESILTTKIRDYLCEKSYLVIFDDVWEPTFWGDIQIVLPDDGKENNRRVIITTRYAEVANFCKVSSCVHIHYLQRLLPEKSWELFCKRAFRDELNYGCCPPDLGNLSREIVERCQGLPLAIVVIAGLLSTKSKTISEWRKLLTTLSSELQSNEHLESITKVLSLSFNDLPYYLKSCFLYLGYFPEDYSIRCGRLIRQWIAEGFVKSQKDKTLEVIAKEYLVDY